MLKRLISSLLIGGMTSLIYLSHIPQEEIVKASPIVETTKIQPNPVILLQNEVRYTRHWDENTSDTTIQLSYEDAQLLMHIASAESLNQGVNGMVKTMTVILNRVESEDFPNTIREVFTQPGQFSTYSNGTWLSADITPECHLALAEVEKNKDLDKTIIAFEGKNNGSKLLAWFDMAYTYRDHRFYTVKKD